MSFISYLWRKFCFWSAYVHSQKSFPYFTWDNPQYKLDYQDLMQCLPNVKAGDIGLRRINGYLSNIAIPGFFKHSFMFTSNCTIVEALDTGVEERHPFYPMLSDYLVILRPRNINRLDLEIALRKVGSIVGKPYDTSFSFDIEEELRCSDVGHLAEIDIQSLGSSFAAKDKCSFTCTEVIAYAYWHVRQQLGIYRHTTAFRKNVIIPDDYLNAGWDIVWCSHSCVPHLMKKRGLSEYSIAKFEEFLNDSKDHSSNMAGRSK